MSTSNRLPVSLSFIPSTAGVCSLWMLCSCSAVAQLSLAQQSLAQQTAAQQSVAQQSVAQQSVAQQTVAQQTVAQHNRASTRDGIPVRNPPAEEVTVPGARFHRRFDQGTAVSQSNGTVERTSCSADRSRHHRESGCDGCQCCVEVARGGHYPVIDALGCLIGIPDKLFLWDRRAKSHSVSPATVAEVVDYLNHRDLRDVKIRVNQYDPVGEWGRLVSNRRIAAPWRYSVGLLKQAKYIFLPGRLFGRDEYNPYTNTLSLYSDLPSLGLVEAAYARDIAVRKCPGTYATAQMFPLVSMWHETIATDEVLTYVAIRGTQEQRRKVRRDLFARYGMQLGGEVSSVLPDGSCVYKLIGASGGHAAAAVHDCAE